MGREATSLINNALEAKVRIESGAAVPEQEIVRMAVRFKPSVFDTERQAKNKMNRLARFLSGAIEILDPNKRYGTDIIKFTGEGGKEYAWVPGNRVDLFESKGEDELINEMDNQALELASGRQALRYLCPDCTGPNSPRWSSSIPRQVDEKQTTCLCIAYGQSTRFFWRLYL